METLAFILLTGSLLLPQQKDLSTPLVPSYLQREPIQVSVAQPPKQVSLPQTQFVAQTYNNCGPAALSMTLSLYGKNISQDVLRTQMRPFSNPDGGIDDKSIFPDEFIASAEEYGYIALHRPNGSVDLLKQLTANGFPVVVRTWLAPEEDIGHFRIVRGYDDARQIIVQDDSYQGPNLEYSYGEFNKMWRPFNYGFILVYPKEKHALVTAILQENMDEKTAYQKVIARTIQAIKETPDDPLHYFNLATAYYHLGQHQKSIEAYEKSESSGLPSRMLWYQLEPLQAYQALHNYERVVSLSDNILATGNEAFSELYQMKGEIYLAQGNKEGAKSEFEKAVYYNTNYEKAKDALKKI